MHLSMHNWMRSEPIEVTIARLARFGYGSIEIKGEPDQYDTKDVRAMLSSYGLSCWGAVTLTLAERNLCAKDEQQRAASVDDYNTQAGLRQHFGNECTGDARSDDQDIEALVLIWRSHRYGSLTCS